MAYARCTFALAAALVSCCAVHADELRTQESEKLDGVWRVISLEINGKVKERKNLRFEFAAYKLTRMEDDERDEEMVFAIHPEKSPKWIDIVEENGRRAKAIYELNGDALTLCFRTSGKLRAETFDGSKGTYQALVKMERVRNRE